MLKQIGWSQEANLLWDISQVLNKIILTSSDCCAVTTTTTTTSHPDCVNGVSFQVTRTGEIQYQDCCGETQYKQVYFGLNALNTCVLYNSLDSSEGSETPALITNIKYYTTECYCPFIRGINNLSSVSEITWISVDSEYIPIGGITEGTSQETPLLNVGIFDVNILLVVEIGAVNNSRISITDCDGNVSCALVDNIIFNYTFTNQVFNLNQDFVITLELGVC